MGKKILVVDDELDLLEMLKTRFESMGYDVVTAVDGHEGLTKAKTEKPDLIILDIMMPKMDGHQVCRLLKFDARYKHIPIVMLTARGQEIDRQMGAEVGADCYITKPFDAAELVKVIKEQLGEE
jgi:DNA-binding response OmpR family regulator